MDRYTQPDFSSYEASERDFRIVLVEDAVSGLYEQGKKEMQNIGVLIMRAEELGEAVSSAMPGL